MKDKQKIGSVEYGSVEAGNFRFSGSAYQFRDGMTLPGE